MVSLSSSTWLGTATLNCPATGFLLLLLLMPLFSIPAITNCFKDRIPRDS